MRRGRWTMRTQHYIFPPKAQCIGRNRCNKMLISRTWNVLVSSMDSIEYAWKLSHNNPSLKVTLEAVDVIGWSFVACSHLRQPKAWQTDSTIIEFSFQTKKEGKRVIPRKLVKLYKKSPAGDKRHNVATGTVELRSILIRRRTHLQMLQLQQSCEKYVTTMNLESYHSSFKKLAMQQSWSIKVFSTILLEVSSSARHLSNALSTDVLTKFSW